MTDPMRSCRARAVGVTMVGLMVMGSGGTALGAELFHDQMTSGLGWGANATGIDYAATFGYDYSADFIPEAPNSAGGDAATTGLKLEANLTAGAGSSVTLYPLAKNFTGDYRLRFDVWCNYDADEHINGSSAATTEFIGGGIGYDGVTADAASGYQMIATGDGGSGSDWRAFADGAFLDAADMAGGDRNGFAAYYSDFLPGVAPPGGQSQTAFPPGSAGSPGFQWITMEYANFGGIVTVSIEKPDASRLTIVTFDTADYPLVGTDGNISLFYADFFSSVTPRPDLTFGLIDNVVVDDVPAPGTPLALGALASAAMCRRRRR